LQFAVLQGPELGAAEPLEGDTTIEGIIPLRRESVRIYSLILGGEDSLASNKADACLL